MSLQQKISQTIEQIRNNPLEHNLRLQLLQFYCLSGLWQQAKKTLNQYLKLNPTDQQTRALFVGNIECEISRLMVFNGKAMASAYSKANQQVALQNQIIQQIENPIQFNRIFLELHQYSSPNLRLQLNDQAELMDEFIDTDIRLSHVFEVFEENRYTWLSLDEIESVQFKPTEILTDLIWRRTVIVLKNKQSIACFVPVRYPFNEDQSLDDNLVYARSTVWENHGDFSTALGQKTLMNTESEIGILDIANIYSI